MLEMKSETAPTLATGAFNLDFGEFEKVDAAIAFTDLAATGANSFQCKAEVGQTPGNRVKVTVYKVVLTEDDGTRVYAAAVTGDLTGKTVTVIANGY
ncbi:hypothetical protein ES703_17270 [subsurface metagenome]